MINIAPTKVEDSQEISSNGTNYVCLVAHPHKTHMVSSYQSSILDWIAETGATAHISFGKKHMSNFTLTTLESRVTDLGYGDFELVTLVDVQKRHCNLRR